MAPPLLSSSAGGQTLNPVALAFIGFIVFIVALAIAAHMVGVPQVWIAIGVLALIGIGIIKASTRSQGPRT
jgi:hypothetical protein